MALFRIQYMMFGMGLVALCFTTLSLWEMLHYQDHMRGSSNMEEAFPPPEEDREANYYLAAPPVPETVAEMDIIKSGSNYQSDTSTTGSDTPATGSETSTAVINSPVSTKGETAKSEIERHDVTGSVTPFRITHFPTRVFTPPTSQTQKLEAKFGISLEDCRLAHVMAPRLCRGYEEMRFLAEPGRSVGLASFPGSGNTWLRLLLEQATGVLTGSVYSDRTLKCTGFLAEGSRGRSYSEMLAIKTHDYNRKWEAAIFLIRNPYKAIISYYNWKTTGSHTKTRSAPRKIGQNLFESFVNHWKQLWDFYVFNQEDPFPVQIIQYENLIRDIRNELKKATVFLNQTVPLEKFECLEKENNDHYQRKQHSSENLLSYLQIELIDAWIQEHKTTLTEIGVEWEKWDWNSEI